MVIVQLQQAVHVARVESLLKGRINVSGLHGGQRCIHLRETLRTQPLQQKGRRGCDNWKGERDEAAEAAREEGRPTKPQHHMNDNAIKV